MLPRANYRIREFAALAGTTVRALHHYDYLGLLKPRQRSAAGYRLYEDQDLERLEQIVALKFLGIPLQQIGNLLHNDSPELAEALRMQRVLLQAKRQMLERAIQAIGEAEAHIRSNGGDKAAALRRIVEVIEMENNNDWMEKYQTEESRAKVEKLRQNWSPELQERMSRDWAELIGDVEEALDTDPAGEKGQELAARWKRLVEEFTGGDHAVSASVGRMWQDRENWPKKVDYKTPRISPAVWEFIQRAMNAAAR